MDGYRGLTNRIRIDYNQTLMVYNKFANKILKTIRGLEKEMVADKGSKPIDSYRNRCLTLIEKLQEIYSGDDHSREKIECLKSAFDVYSNLQRKSDENSGTQDIARRELADTPRLRSSRGYASMNWSAIGWTKGGGSDRLRGYYGGPKVRGLKTPYRDDLSKTDYWCVRDDKRKK